MSGIGSLASAAFAASLIVLSAANSWAQATCRTIGNAAGNTLTWGAGFDRWDILDDVAGGFIAATPGVDGVSVCYGAATDVATIALTGTYDYFFGESQDFSAALHGAVSGSSDPFLYAKSIPVLWAPFLKKNLGTSTGINTVGDLITGLPTPSLVHTTVAGTDLTGLHFNAPANNKRMYVPRYVGPSVPAPLPQITTLGPKIRDIAIGLGFSWADPATPTQGATGLRVGSTTYDSNSVYGSIENGGASTFTATGILGKEVVYWGGLLEGTPPFPGLEEGAYVEFPGFAVDLYAIRLKDTPAAQSFYQYFQTSVQDGSWNARLSTWQYGTIPALPPAPVPIGPYTAPLTAALLLALGLYGMSRRDTLRLA